ncbi:MAG: twin-arginine translocase subunit TatC [Verrucomicrobia bacterium]|nr:twin-arginine translocase subunit TatC [Verrucomicrobiota bacterium]
MANERDEPFPKGNDNLDGSIQSDDASHVPESGPVQPAAEGTSPESGNTTGASDSNEPAEMPPGMDPGAASQNYGADSGVEQTSHDPAGNGGFDHHSNDESINLGPYHYDAHHGAPDEDPYAVKEEQTEPASTLAAVSGPPAPPRRALPVAVGEFEPDEEEEEGGGPVKSFLEHLEDLRWTIIKSGASLVVGMIICLIAAPYITELLKYPLQVSGIQTNLELFDPLGGFMISLKLAFYSGLVISLPFILLFIGQFIVPALKRREKKYFFIAFTVGTGFFMTGIVLCYLYLLPFSLGALVQYNKYLGFDAETWRGEAYFEFVSKFLLGVGLMFEMPVVILSLIRLEIIPHAMLVKGRRYMFVVNFAICALLTPADIITTMAMTVALQVVYEICILISTYWDRQRKRKLGETA